MDDQVKEIKKEVQLSDFKPFHYQLDEIRYFDKILDRLLNTEKKENENEQE